MMKNYFDADIKRIHSKRSYLIVLAVVYVLMAFIAGLQCGNPDSYLSMADIIAGSMPIFLGTIVFFAVFQDDAKTGTMQVAIGRGLTRKQVIWAKVLEGLVLTVVYYLVAALILSLVPLVLPISLTAANVFDIWSTTVQSILDTFLFFNIGMIIFVACFKVNFAEITYILFAFSIIPGALNVILGVCYSKFGMPNLLPLLYDNMTGAFIKEPLAHLGSGLGIIIYIVVSLWLTIRIFRKKELEF